MAGLRVRNPDPASRSLALTSSVGVKDTSLDSVVVFGDMVRCPRVVKLSSSDTATLMPGGEYDMSTDQYAVEQQRSSYRRTT
jgi:hypothetical protein